MQSHSQKVIQADWINSNSKKQKHVKMIAMGAWLDEKGIRKVTVSCIGVLTITIGYFGAKVFSYAKEVEATKAEYLRVVAEYDREQAMRKICSEVCKEVNDKDGAEGICCYARCIDELWDTNRK